jgi:hypothetical protein
LLAVDGSQFSTTGLTLTAAINAAVTALTGSHGTLNDTRISGSGDGIVASSNASLVMDGGTITGSGTFGASAETGGSITLRGGAVVSGSGFHGVTAGSNGSVYIEQATVRDSHGTGVFAFSGGSVDVDGGLVQGNHLGPVSEPEFGLAGSGSSWHGTW